MWHLGPCAFPADTKRAAPTILPPPFVPLHTFSLAAHGDISSRSVTDFPEGTWDPGTLLLQTASFLEHKAQTP